MADARSFWRPPNSINTKEYKLYMENPAPLKLPYPLESHTLGAPEQQLSDSLSFTSTEWVRGQVKTFNKIARPAEELMLDIPLGFPQGALWTPAYQRAKNGVGCETDFYALYTCPADICFAHFWVFPDAQIDPPNPTSMYASRDDQEMFVEETTLHVRERLLYLHLDGYKINSVVDATFTSVDANLADCPGCEMCINTYYIGGQNDDGALGLDPTVWKTEDRGLTFTEYDLNTLVTATTAHFVTKVLSDGDYVVAPMADVLSPGPGAAGGIAYSQDGGANWLLDAGVASAQYTAFILSGVPYVAGNAGELYSAETKQDFAAITQSATAETFLCSAVDVENNIAYIGGTNGALVAFDGTSVIDLTAALGIATPVLSVAVAGSRWVQVGSTGGVFYESFDGGDTWTLTTVAGTTDDITSIRSDKHRTIIGTDVGNAYYRDLTTNFLFKLLPYEFRFAPATALVGLAFGEGHNNLAGVFAGTDGTFMLIRPCHPDLCGDEV